MDNALPAVLIALGLGAVVAAAAYTTSGGTDDQPKDTSEVQGELAANDTAEVNDEQKGCHVNDEQEDATRFEGNVAPGTRESVSIHTVPEKEYGSSAEQSSQVNNLPPRSRRLPSTSPYDSMDKIGYAIESITRVLNESDHTVPAKESVMSKYERIIGANKRFKLDPLLVDQVTEYESQLKALNPMIKNLLVEYLDNRIEVGKYGDARRINNFLQKYGFIGDTKHDQNETEIKKAEMLKRGVKLRQ